MYMLIKIYLPVVTMYITISLYNITIVRDGGILNIQLECSYNTCSLGKEVKVECSYNTCSLGKEVKVECSYNTCSLGKEVKVECSYNTCSLGKEVKV